MGCLSGLEPPVLGATIRRFNQLSYKHMAEAPRFERRLLVRVGRISNPLEYPYPMPPCKILAPT